MRFERVTIFGTGLIGASIGLALRARALCGEVQGWDRSGSELEAALRRGAIDRAASDPVEAAQSSDLVVLAVPVLAILDWMERLSPALTAGQLVTDVGSTKKEIAHRATLLFGGEDQALFLPGHPMAGKEFGGAALADKDLFAGATWLFTPCERECAATPQAQACALTWRASVTAFGAQTMDLEAERHDVVCAWVSHLPQMVATALASVLEEQCKDAPELRAIGGRALREMTRLGASPFSMWRDIAHTNCEPVARTLLALELRLAEMREHLRNPELREIFERANAFRLRRYGALER